MNPRPSARLWTSTAMLMDIYRAKQAHGLEIIDISVDRSREVVLCYVEKNGIEWPQVISKKP